MDQDNSRKRVSHVSFSMRNPPPSEDLAVLRLQILTEDVNHIGRQLEQRSVSDFRSLDDFDEWFRRANAALVGKCSEIDFLHTWLSLPEEDRISRDSMLSKLKEESRIFAESVTSDMLVRGFKSGDPVDLEDAITRRYTISLYVRVVEQYRRKLKFHSKRFSFSKSEWSHVVSDLGEFHDMITLERTMLTTYIRRRLVDDPEFSWKVACKKLIIRLRDSGVEFSAEDEAVMAFLDVIPDLN